MSERKTVTLFIYLPENKQVVLSRRGKLEKHAGILQASVHGQIEPGEIVQLALKREFKEELKGDFHQLSKFKEYGSKTVGSTTPEKTFYYAASLRDDQLKTLHTTQEVEEFVLINEDQIKKILPYSQVKGKEEYEFFKKNMVMFDDEINVIKKVFADNQ